MKITKNGKMEMEYLTDGVVNNGFSDDEDKNERVIREIDFHRDILLIEEVFGKDTKMGRKIMRERIDDFLKTEFEIIPIQTRKAIIIAMVNNKGKSNKKSAETIP